MSGLQRRGKGKANCSSNHAILVVAAYHSRAADMVPCLPIPEWHAIMGAFKPALVRRLVKAWISSGSKRPCCWGPVLVQRASPSQLFDPTPLKAAVVSRNLIRELNILHEKPWLDLYSSLLCDLGFCRNNYDRNFEHTVRAWGLQWYSESFLMLFSFNNPKRGMEEQQDPLRMIDVNEVYR